MNRIKYMNQGVLPLLILMLFTFSACKKLVQVDGPTTSISSKNIYQKNVTAASVLTGIYTNLSLDNLSSGLMPSTSYLTALSSDELTMYDPNAGWIPGAGMYYANALTVVNGGAGFEFWTKIYPMIYVINDALEGVTNSETLTPAVKQQLLGEARFMRAFSFFYLVNLYGDVPLTLTTDYKANALLKRSPKAKVYEQIITDLKEAQSLLSHDYLDATLQVKTSERVRPTLAAATALLARVYLYTKDWENAEIQATTVLDNPAYSLVKLDSVFLANNKEAIWQLPPVYKGGNSPSANLFLLDSVYGLDGYSVYLNQRLVNSFDAGDQRKTHWVNMMNYQGVDYYYAYKYKIRPFTNINDPFYEYTDALRVGEQYLIRAEARIQQNKISDGIDDLNAIRARATDKSAPPASQLQPLSTGLSQEDALMAVEHERQVELFTEWGHRWLDLKRTDRIDAVMSQVVPEKMLGATWKSYQQWYPIFLGDVQTNPNLVQNEGY